MSAFYLDLRAAPGSDIADCARQACALASRLELTVTFKFNGVSCLACPGDDPQSLVGAWHRSLGSDLTHPIARGRP